MDANPVVTRREAIGLGVCLAVVGPARWATAQQPAPADQGAILDWQDLGRGVSFIEHPSGNGNCASWAVGGQRIVIDTQTATTAEAIYRDVSAMPSGAELTMVNTHFHLGHVGGNCAFKGRSRMVTLERTWRGIQRQDDQLLRGARQAEADAIEQGLPPRAVAAAADLSQRETARDLVGWAPDLMLDSHGRPLPIGEAEVDLIYRGPCHTVADLIIHDPGRNVVAVGDLVFNGVYPFADSGASVFAWIETLAWIRDNLTDADTIVVPGKGPAGGPELLDAKRELLERFVEAVRSARDAGVRTYREIDVSFAPDPGGRRARDAILAVIAEELEQREGPRS